jgi:anti-sigma factor RsiW
MRAIIIAVVAASLGAWLSACCDCAQAVADKDAQIAALERQVADLEGRIAKLADAEPHAAEPAAARPAARRAPADLAACVERLKACELDPFKGGKYFTSDKGEPKPGTAPAGGELLDPFMNKPKADPPPGEVKDPFSKN